MRTQFTDSIDGYGMTFDDLSTKGRQKILFRVLQQMTAEERAEMEASLDRAKASSDANQEKLREAISRPATIKKKR